MSAFTFQLPTRVVFGRGELDHLGREAQGLGRRALVVTGASAMRKHGCLDRAEVSLREAGVEPVVFDGVPPNPTDAVVDQGAEVARRERCDLVIGLGGGSPMDAAKGIAVGATHEGGIWEYIRPTDGGRRSVTSATLPIVCVPSTAGTGSEVTPFAVISNPDVVEKAALFDATIFPRVAVVDPELTFSAPPDVTAATGVDAFAHALESYVAVRAQPFSDALAREAIRLVGRFLPPLVRDGADEGARCQMVLASLLAGAALSNPGGGVMHALEHPITARFGEVSHGQGLAAVMPACVWFSYAHARGKFDDVAHLLGADAASGPPGDATVVLDAIQRLLRDAHMDVSLAQFGITAADCDVIAADTARYMSRAAANSPGDATEDDFRGILRDSL